MANVGYTLMTEQAGPKDLVRWAARAEDVGFDLLVSSDHYFPWVDEQGHAPNVWVMLGAVAQVTERAELMTYVTCPTMRYHPAVVAQQAATLTLLSGDAGPGQEPGGEPVPGHELNPALPRKAFDRLTTLGRGATSRFNERPQLSGARSPAAFRPADRVSWSWRRVGRRLQRAVTPPPRDTDQA